ncbi:MAG: protein kinase, partial [Phycisphaeraceae bacterium]
KLDPADADALTISQLIGAGVLDAPDEKTKRNDAVAVLDHRYELLSKLGEGGMGVVYLAYDRLGDCDMAVKIVRPRFLQDPAARQRFIDEAKQMNRIPSHAAVLIVKGFGSEKKPYYIMEYMPGGSLTKLIRTLGPLPLDKALPLALAIAKAIQYLHENVGLIHRDIKPDNVMLGGDGGARLCDFGLIRAVGIGAHGLRAGTLAYMPPEVVTDLTKNVAFDWDIYSFGAVLYEMLSGRRPYNEVFQSSANPIEQVRQLKDEILKRPPRMIQEMNRTADPGLAKIAVGCMAREGRERYFKMADVVADLQRVGKGLAPLGPLQGRDSAAAMHRRTRVEWVVFLLLAAGLAGGVYWQDPFGWFKELPASVTPEKDITKDTTKDATKDTTKDTGKDAGKAQQGGLTKTTAITGIAALDEMPLYPAIGVSINTLQDRTAYVEGETISFQAQADQVGNLTLLMISLDHPQELVYVLFPNGNQPAAEMQPGVPMLVPSPAAVLQLPLKVLPPHGRLLIRAIVTRRPIRFTDGVDEPDEGYTTLDRAKIKVRLLRGDGQLQASISALMKDTEWAVKDLVVTTTGIDGQK